MGWRSPDENTPAPRFSFCLVQKLAGSSMRAVKSLGYQAKALTKMNGEL
jgi:hypothetical protein